MPVERLKVPLERLTRVCDPDSLGFETTSEVKPLQGTIAQDRAMSALELGLGIDADGFNIFVSGAPGTGRNTALRECMERVAQDKPNPPDWGYLHNFRDPSQPVAVALPGGEMRAFSWDMDELVQTCRAEIPSKSESLGLAKRFQLVISVLETMRDKYAGRGELEEYLDEVNLDMVSNIEAFSPTGDVDSARSVEDSGDDFFTRYRVNRIVENAPRDGAPIVFEHNPTYYNLFGRIDYRAHMGAMATDHMMIKPGSIHKANGGYLVLQANDLLANPLSWDALKRALRSGEIHIENIGERNSAFPTSSMRPQPIPLNAKIVLVGSAPVLRRLRRTEPDFRRYFKVAAEFDTVMERTAENVGKYAAFVSGQVSEKSLRPFDKTAVAAIVDYSSRLTQDQEKLTTRFMGISDIMSEADYWAGKLECDIATSEHVTKAIAERRYRASAVEDRILESIERDAVRISTEGRVVGQVNGLAVYFRGGHNFGRPSRITARVSVGRGQVVNVERDTRMSGRIHNKGFMILRGYLNGKYGERRPLSMSASVTFEQTYGSVDGDSASSTELYALLSALSEVPIKQGIAVTGSVDQTGEVQSIGGATHKIEGFFDVCKAKGLTGEQGVVIPRANVRNLTLRPEVVEAARDGAFHIYAVSRIDEGIEVLTGTEAGEKGKDGKYPEGTIHFLVERRLEEMSSSARRASRSRSESDTGDGRSAEEVSNPERQGD